ncbi:hypothetical protein OQA88_6239 [Cercophora sp. LCS_1]
MTPSYPSTLDLSPTSQSSDGDQHSFERNGNGMRVPNGIVTSTPNLGRVIPSSDVEQAEEVVEVNDEVVMQDTLALFSTVNGYHDSFELVGNPVEPGLDDMPDLGQDIEIDEVLSGSLVVNLSSGSTDDGSAEEDVEMSPPEYRTSSVGEGAMAASDIRSFARGRAGSWRDRRGFAMRTTPRTASPALPYPRRPRARHRAARTGEGEEEEEQPSWPRVQ